MARQRDSKLVGTVENLIFYNRLGNYCMRKKPANVRRTRASVNSGLNFGKASRISRQIRSLVEPINPLPMDSLVRNRLNGVLTQFISWKEKKDAASVTLPDQLPFIEGFQFNGQADLSSIFAIRAAVNTTWPDHTEISLAPFIPGQSLHAPGNTNHILLKLILAGINLNDVDTVLLGKSEMEIPYSGEIFQPPVISIPAVIKPGNLGIVVMSVLYMINRNGGIEMLNDKKKLPCGVLWASFFNLPGTPIS